MASQSPEAAAGLSAIALELDSAGANPESILRASTSALSRLEPATWVGVVMNSDPETCRVIVANDGDPAMAEWVNDYIASVDRPNRAPNVGLSQRVIETGEPVSLAGVSYEEFVTLLSPAGQAFCRTNPPPNQAGLAGCLIVPMRVGGAVIGTLGMFDWPRGDGPVGRDLSWVQSVADRIALSLDYARLLHTVHADAERMDVVRALAMAGRHGQDLRVTLREIVEEITGRLPVDASDLLAITENGKDFSVAASAGFRLTSPAEYRIPIDAVQPSSDGRRPHVDSLNSLKSTEPRRSHFAREGFQTFVWVPLYAGSRLVGVLEIYNRSVVEWERQWLDFFDTLGGLLGAAIDHARPAASLPPAAKSRGAALPALSPLEFEIVRLIADGLTNREIGDQLHRSENTIKFHVRRILERTGAANRTELARRATREDWL